MLLLSLPGIAFTPGTVPHSHEVALTLPTWYSRGLQAHRSAVMPEVPATLPPRVGGPSPALTTTGFSSSPSYSLASCVVYHIQRSLNHVFIGSQVNISNSKFYFTSQTSLLLARTGLPKQGPPLSGSGNNPL